MPDTTNGASNLYALLMGVDHYFENTLPDGSSYPSLNGCVRDVERVEAFLKRTRKLKDEHVKKLVATHNFRRGEDPPELPEQWPTYANMVNAFAWINNTAGEGDQVYIHYSGHGGRATTSIPRVKGENGIDEGLVPLDIGKPEGQYLRDHELAKLLKTMVDKGLLVTVVLDSCHSGGMTRGSGDVAVRGLSTVDTTPRPTPSAVATADELGQLWTDLTGGEGGTRAVKMGGGWLPEPEGYVMLSACRKNELAREAAFEGIGKCGVLTHWFLETMEDLSSGISYKNLHDRILPRVHGRFEEQTPMLQGDGDREVFGSDRVEPHYAVGVLEIDRDAGLVKINAGKVLGIRKGAQFAVYPSGTEDFTDTSKRLALLEVSKQGATDSLAEVKDGELAEISPGDQAVLLGAGSVKLVRKVTLERRDDLPATIDQEAALQAVEQALEGNGWMEVATGDELPDYQVALDETGAYEIWDEAGKPINNLRPAIKPDEPDAAARVVKRLVHLAKYQSVMELFNHARLNPLAGVLEVEWVGKEGADYDEEDEPDPKPFDDPGNAPVVTEGEFPVLRVKNTSDQALNVTMLDLANDWSVVQFYPARSGNFVTFDPGEEQLFPLSTGLPAGYEHGTDLIKVFATVGDTNFRMLELPALDKPQTRAATRSAAPRNPLENLLSAVSEEKPKTRSVSVGSSGEWIVAQVEVKIRKPVSVTA